MLQKAFFPSERLSMLSGLIANSYGRWNVRDPSRAALRDLQAVAGLGYLGY
jgi:hypothetical protein